MAGVVRMDEDSGPHDEVGVNHLPEVITRQGATAVLGTPYRLDAAAVDNPGPLDAVEFATQEGPRSQSARRLMQAGSTTPEECTTAHQYLPKAEENSAGHVDATPSSADQSTTAAHAGGTNDDSIDLTVACRRTGVSRAVGRSNSRDVAGVGHNVWADGRAEAAMIVTLRRPRQHRAASLNDGSHKHTNLVKATAP